MEQRELRLAKQRERERRRHAVQLHKSTNNVELSAIVAHHKQQRPHKVHNFSDTFFLAVVDI